MNTQTKKTNERSALLAPDRIPRPVRSSLLLLVCLVSTITFFNASQNVQARGIIEKLTARTPWGVVSDSKNHLWVAEPGCNASPICRTSFPGTIGEYSTIDASLIHNYQQPPGFSGPLFIAVDYRGNIWFTEPTHNALGELIPGNRPRWQQWIIPTPAAIPYQLLFDKTGRLWFSELGSSKIGFFNPGTRRFVENALPTPDSHPYGLTLAPDGSIWLAESSLAKLGSFMPVATGKVRISEHIIPTSSPHLLTSDKQGNVWYSAGFSGIIGRYTPRTRVTIEYAVSQGVCHGRPNCQGTYISGIAISGNGLIWFDDALGQRIGNLNPTTGTLKILRIGSAAHPFPHPHDGLAVDAQNNLWFTEEFANILAELPVKFQPLVVKHQPSFQRRKG